MKRRNTRRGEKKTSVRNEEIIKGKEKMKARKNINTYQRPAVDIKTRNMRSDKRRKKRRNNKGE